MNEYGLTVKPAGSWPFFNTLDLRNDLMHGKRHIGQVTYPVSELRDLLRRYIDAAIEQYGTITP